MEILIIILVLLAVVVSIVGIIGAIVPAIPGPPLSFASLLVAYFVAPGYISLSLLIGLYRRCVPGAVLHASRTHCRTAHRCFRRRIYPRVGPFESGTCSLAFVHRFPAHHRHQTGGKSHHDFLHDGCLLSLFLRSDISPPRCSSFRRTT